MHTYLKFFFLLIVISSCKKSDKKFGELVSPSKPQLTVTVVGKDATHPTGDGSGTVKVVVVSTHAINYKVDFGDGLPALLSTSNADEDVLLFDLDNNTGTLSNYRWIDNPTNFIFSLNKGLLA